MVARILGIILPVFVVILVGYLYARRMRPDMTEVNRLSMLILGPALVFSALASKQFDLAANLPLIAASVGVVLGRGQPEPAPGCRLGRSQESGLTSALAPLAPLRSRWWMLCTMWPGEWPAGLWKEMVLMSRGSRCGSSRESFRDCRRGEV